MCLMIFSYEDHPHYRLVLLANRDEFYHRPTAPLGYWKEVPGVLAGRDLEGNGTWLGVTTTGRLAGVTNFRDPTVHVENGPSRGVLVADFLLGSRSPADYIESLRPQAHQTNGYNLILGDGQELCWYSNRGKREQVLPPGVYGLSNHLLNTPWPKVEKGIAGLRDLLGRQGRPDVEDYFKLLADPVPFPDQTLPHTGIGREWERLLSPLFISSPDYGTRSSAVILIRRDGHVTFAERTHDPGVPGSPEERTRRFEFYVNR